MRGVADLPAIISISDPTRQCISEVGAVVGGGSVATGRAKSTGSPSRAESRRASVSFCRLGGSVRVSDGNN